MNEILGWQREKTARKVSGDLGDKEERNKEKIVTKRILNERKILRSKVSIRPRRKGHSGGPAFVGFVSVVTEYFFPYEG